MFSVKYDSTELVNSTYNLQYARDNSAPPREFTLVPFASEDGSIIVYDRYGVKHIKVKGFISAATPAALQTAVDSFKELFSRRDKNLDITPDGGTLRRYVANCASHTLIGDYYNLTFLPYEADFIIKEAVGKSTAYTTIIDATMTAFYSTSHILSIGSAPEQKPKFTFTFTTPASITGVELGTVSTTYDIDTSMIVTGAFASSKILEIDCDAKTVKYDGDSIDYYGTFPRAVLGSDGITFTLRFGLISVEYNTTGGLAAYSTVYGNDYVAQSFMVKHTDSTYRRLALRLDSEGSPPNDFTATIEGDNDGVPDGVAVATFTVAYGSITPVYTYMDNAADFSLTGNTKYWIVMYDGGGGSATDYYKVRYLNADTYSKGNYATSDDSGNPGTWVDDYDKDLVFILYLGGKASGAYSIPTVVNYKARYL